MPAALFVHTHAQKCANRDNRTGAATAAAAIEQLSLSFQKSFGSRIRTDIIYPVPGQDTPAALAGRPLVVAHDKQANHDMRINVDSTKSDQQSNNNPPQR